MHMAEIFQSGGRQVNGNEPRCSIDVSRYRGSDEPVFVTPPCESPFSMNGNGDVREDQWGVGDRLFKLKGACIDRTFCVRAPGQAGNGVLEETDKRGGDWSDSD